MNKLHASGRIHARTMYTTFILQQVQRFEVKLNICKESQNLQVPAGDTSQVGKIPSSLR